MNGVKAMLVVVLAAALALACGDERTGGKDGETTADGGSVTASAADAIKYMDDLSKHPGCTTKGLTYKAASIPGYACAAKDYTASGADPAKSIVLLIHGNSDEPDVWERYPSGKGIVMVAEKIRSMKHRVYAVDLRKDRVCKKAGGIDPCSNLETENAAQNMDHGWGVPIVQRLIKAVMTANPNSKVSIIGHSFGVTLTRDALRRLQVNDGFNPWKQLDQLIYAAGANHGVSSWKLCNSNPTMRGKVVSEMGNRDNFTPTAFLKVLNGPDSVYETPCLDGNTAFGKAKACGGNKVSYTTIVMKDISQGTYQDKFVSETSSALKGADNKLIGLGEFDKSGYFFQGLFKNHYGPVRASAALNIIQAKVQ